MHVRSFNFWLRCVEDVVQICYDRQTGKPLGYAVVHFTDALSAQQAIGALNSAVVDGRQIVVAPYRSRIADPNAPRQPAQRRAPASSPGLNEAFGAVLDLHKSATWMCALSLPPAICQLVQAVDATARGNSYLRDRCVIMTGDG
jgi:RNA recognition motif. (a.k.a. RRM, RBD, or RNP domain)